MIRLSFKLALLFLFVTGMISSSYATNEGVPQNCKPFVLKHDKIIPSSTKTMAVMIHNVSDLSIWITHPTKNDSMSAGFNSLLEADHWSTLVISGKSFLLQCIESKPGHEQLIACDQVLTFCELISAKLPSQSSENYWAKENKGSPNK